MIILATKNPHKKREFSQMLDFDFKTLDDFDDIEIIEDGDTYIQNANIKSIAAADSFNVVALGDDSGIAVDALDGKPGIHSARYGGEEYGPDNK